MFTGNKMCPTENYTVDCVKSQQNKKTIEISWALLKT